MKAIAAALLVLGSFTCFAQQPSESQRPDHSRAVLFFHQFRDALKRGDRKAVSDLVRYPIPVQLHGRTKRIKSRADLIAHYDQIFDSGIRCEVLTASDVDVFGNSHGFSFKHGAVWFESLLPAAKYSDSRAPDFWTKGAFKVLSINNGRFYPCKNAPVFE